MDTMQNTVEKYCGHRTREGCLVFHYKNGLTTQITVEKSLGVRFHSPTGFEWGYGGSGPAQLALAILLNETNSPETSNDLHQKFKFEFVTKLDDDWEIDAVVVRNWVAQQTGH